MKPYFFAFFVLPLAGLAQNPAVPVLLIQNGGFNQFVAEDNLWDGVDSDGFLCGDVSFQENPARRRKPEPRGIFFRRLTNQCDVILEGGNVAPLAMPISVQVADLNGDGLLDLVTVDGGGYFRVYFNTGTRTEPKFTQGEMVPLFLGRIRRIFGRSSKGFVDDGLKIALGDMGKAGLLDLVMGNYYGDVMLIRNTGTPASPEWRIPKNFEQIQIPTTRDGHLWCNLAAPAVFDWNKDGKPDLLVGEGSYSANAVHLLLNGVAAAPANGGFVGSSSFSTSQAKRPLLSFNKDANDYLAFGDGREQLVPAVVDYNGDGNPDLLVGDRTGNINVYLSKGSWTKGVELAREPQPISFGGVSSIGADREGARCVAPVVGDFNGDGKFDIIVGKPNGHIAFAYNVGTIKEPKFGPLEEIKGEDLWKEGSIKVPKDWDVSFGYKNGNINGAFTIVTPAEDPEAAGGGASVLKFFYEPNLNKIVRRQPMLLPDSGLEGTPARPVHPQSAFGPDGVTPHFMGGDSLGSDSLTRDSNIAVLSQVSNPAAIRPNARYTLSFKVKGRDVKKCRALVLFGGWLVRDLATARARGTDPDNHVTEALATEIKVSVTPAWTTVSQSLSFQFRKESELNHPEKWSKPGSKIEYRSFLDIRASVMPDAGVLYISDVRITPM